MLLTNEYPKSQRHRWYSYKEAFSHDLVLKAIKDCSITNEDLILDIFNGGGTVTLTSSLKGLNSIGVEVNPFSSFVSKVKLTNYSPKIFEKYKDLLLSSCKEITERSPLLKFSTFSEKGNSDKWLFNSSVLNTFETLWCQTDLLPRRIGTLMKLPLIGAAMDNCNAVKDGKCLKYRSNWDCTGFNKKTFFESFKLRLDDIQYDLETEIIKKAKVYNSDSRVFLDNPNLPQFKLCITSPPYLNSFDYTDIYRPELFLGKFIKDNSELKKLRFKTLRSHVEIKLPKISENNFGILYQTTFADIQKDGNFFWDNQIPVMIQSYFADMKNILQNLFNKASTSGHLWIVIANSAYYGIEIPVDLILAEIGGKIGWHLQEIEVLRYINKRTSNHSKEIKQLRESIVKLIRV